MAFVLPPGKFVRKLKQHETEANIKLAESIMKVLPTKLELPMIDKVRKTRKISRQCQDHSASINTLSVKPE
jgi:hypothetical protein